MNLLLIPADYPHRAAEWAGAQNEQTALALQQVVQHLEVLVPNPYAPRVLDFNDRWRAHTLAPREEVRSGIRVHRPAYPVVPRLLQAFWPTTAAYLFSRRLAKRLNRAIGFDAILSFDLSATGGLAWRLGKDLGIPACGWATGSDIRWNARSSIGRSVREALENLDLVFYQSGELKVLGADLLGTRAESLPKERHVVQSRGVAIPERLPGEAERRSIRSRLQVGENQVVILYLGRIVHGKGIFDLVDAFAERVRVRADVMLLLVGSRPGHDETPELQERIRSLRVQDGHIRILPGCEPRRVWDYFKAADIFAFPSFREGMPNSLLEAMLTGLPAVAFAIPAIQEITRFGEGLIEVHPHDFSSFGDALLKLADDPSLRREVASRGRAIVQEHFSLHRNMRAVAARLARLTAN